MDILFDPVGDVHHLCGFCSSTDEDLPIGLPVEKVPGCRREKEVEEVLV